MMPSWSQSDASWESSHRATQSPEVLPDVCIPNRSDVPGDEWRGGGDQLRSLGIGDDAFQFLALRAILTVREVSRAHPSEGGQVVLRGSQQLMRLLHDVGGLNEGVGTLNVSFVDRKFVS